jgi:hypothetical protein
VGGTGGGGGSMWPSRDTKEEARYKNPTTSRITGQVFPK